MLTANPLKLGKKFPPDEEASRMTLYMTNKQLWNGAHEKVFPEWTALLKPERKAQVWMILQWYDLLSTLWPDMLVGEPPQFTVTGTKEQAWLDRLVSENELVSKIYELGIDVSRYGDGLFNLWTDGQVHIDTAPAPVWFPWADPRNVKDVQGCVLGWRTTDDRKFYLDTQTHTRSEGKSYVQRQRWQTSDDGTILRELEGDEAPVATGISDLLIVPVHNVTTSDIYFGRDDYSVCDSIIEELESRFSQVKSILDKHSDPNLEGPDSVLQENPETKELEIRTGGKYFPLNPGENVSYLTWDGKLESAFTEIDKLTEWLYRVSGISPALFGGDFGRAESGSAMKRLLISTLRKINRLRLQFDPVVKRVLAMASELAVANSVPGAVLLQRQDIHIGWQDGLPQDVTEMASAHTMLFTGGLESRETAVATVLEKGGTALQEELKAITKDERQAQPEPPAANVPPDATVSEPVNTKK